MSPALPTVESNNFAASLFALPIPSPCAERQRTASSWLFTIPERSLENHSRYWGALLEEEYLRLRSALPRCSRRARPRLGDKALVSHRASRGRDQGVHDRGGPFNSRTEASWSRRTPTSAQSPERPLAAGGPSHAPGSCWAGPVVRVIVRWPVRFGVRCWASESW